MEVLSFGKPASAILSLTVPQYLSFSDETDVDLMNVIFG